MKRHKVPNYVRTRIECSLWYDTEFYANLVVIKGQYRVTIFCQFQLFITTIMYSVIKYITPERTLKNTTDAQLVNKLIFRQCQEAHI